MKNFTELDVWIQARELNKMIYELTSTFPREETYSLTSQMRRASISISSNISEGAGRRTEKDNNRFLYNARGSAFELESQMYVAIDLKYSPKNKGESIIAHINRVKMLINGTIRYNNSKMK